MMACSTLALHQPCCHPVAAPLNRCISPSSALRPGDIVFTIVVLLAQGLNHQEPGLKREQPGCAGRGLGISILPAPPAPAPTNKRGPRRESSSRLGPLSHATCMELCAIHMQIRRGVFPQTVTSHVTGDITASENNLDDLLAKIYFLH